MTLQHAPPTLPYKHGSLEGLSRRQGKTSLSSLAMFPVAATDTSNYSAPQTSGSDFEILLLINIIRRGL